MSDEKKESLNEMLAAPMNDIGKTIIICIVSFFVGFGLTILFLN